MQRRVQHGVVDADRDDAVLVASACAGDHSAFGVLFRRHAPDLVRFVERRTGVVGVADDVVAVTFEKAWRQVCDISGRGIAFRPWIFRLAGNELIDQQRGAARRRRREAAVSAGDRRLVDAAHQPSEADRDDELRAAISELSTAHQEVVALRWFADLTPKEVATALGVTTGTAAVRTHRALAALRRSFTEPEDDIRKSTTTTTSTARGADG